MFGVFKSFLTRVTYRIVVLLIIMYLFGYVMHQSLICSYFHTCRLPMDIQQIHVRTVEPVYNGLPSEQGTVTIIEWRPSYKDLKV